MAKYLYQILQLFSRFSTQLDESLVGHCKQGLKLPLFESKIRKWIDWKNELVRDF